MNERKCQSDTQNTNALGSQGFVIASISQTCYAKNGYTECVYSQCPKRNVIPIARWLHGQFWSLTNGETHFATSLNVLLVFLQGTLKICNFNHKK